MLFEAVATSPTRSRITRCSDVRYGVSTSEGGRDAMVRLLARVVGIGIETADMLVQEVFSRKLRDRKAVARYAGLTGAPDESGQKRRERGLAKAGNARVRHAMIELAWGHLLHQKDSALAEWYQKRTVDRLASSSSTVGIAAMLQCFGSPRSQPRRARLSSSVSRRSVFARLCSRDTGTLDG